MAFELQVTFTGLNLFLAHTDGNQVAVLQPDCTVDPSHEDGSKGVPHVGYLRFDLANLCQCLPAGAPDEIPLGEGVYRFKECTLEFGIEGGGPITIADLMPDFDMFAPTLQPLPTLFTGSPGPSLLMRTILRGGDLGLDEDPEERRQMPQVLNPNPTDPEVELRNSITWKRKVEGTGLTLTIRDFMGNPKAEFPLRALGEPPVIALKVGNLCSDNPLEWNEFPPPQVSKDDEDFKWLYRLLELPAGRDYRTELKGSAFPIPRLLPSGPIGVENCTGGLKREQTFDLPDGKTFAPADGVQ